MAEIKKLGVTDNAESQLLSGISASATTIPLKVGGGALFPTALSASATSAGTATTLNSTGIQAAGVVVGDYLYNVTDGSSAVVTVVATNSVTTTPLTGGSTNLWNDTNIWSDSPFLITINTRDTDGVVTAYEKVLIYKRSGDTIYAVASTGRGYDGSSAQTWDADTYVSLLVTSKTIKELQIAISRIYREMSLDSNVVHKTGDESVAGVKTFSSHPKINSYVAPTQNEEYTPKQYVDALSGGSTIKAGEAITQGDFVRYINNAGTTEVTRVNGFSVTGIGNVLGSGVTTIFGVAYSSTDNLYVAIYHDASSNAKAVCFSFDGTTISAGSAITVDGTSALVPSIVYDPTNNRFFVSYVKSSNLYGCVVKISTPGSKTLSGGTPAVIYAGNAPPTICYNPTASKVVVGYMNAGDSDYYSVVCTISDMSFSQGSTDKIFTGTGVNGQLRLAYDSVNDKLLVSYRNNASYPELKVGTLSGTTYTYGSATSLTTEATDTLPLILGFSPKQGKFLMWGTLTTSYGAKLYTVTISGTTATVGDITSISGVAGNYGFPLPCSGYMYSQLTNCYDLESDSFDVPLYESSTPYNAPNLNVRIKGTRIEYDMQATGIVDSSGTRILAQKGKYSDNFRSWLRTSAGALELVRVIPETRHLCIGVAQNTVPLASNTAIKFFGMVSTVHSSLLVGERYFIQSNGTAGVIGNLFPAGYGETATRLFLQNFFREYQSDLNSYSTRMGTQSVTTTARVLHGLGKRPKKITAWTFDTTDGILGMVVWCLGWETAHAAMTINKTVTGSINEVDETAFQISLTGTITIIWVVEG